MSIGQKLLPTPNMVSQPDRHRRTPTPITTPLRKVINKRTQTPMRTQPVALKQTQHHCRIPQTHPPRKSVGLARQTVQTIPQHPVQTLAVNHLRTIHRRPQHTTRLNTHPRAAPTTLDRLRQAHASRRRQARTPPLAHTLRIPIHARNRPPIDRPSITQPRDAPLSRRPSPRLRPHTRRRRILRTRQRPSPHKARGTLQT